MIEHILKGQMGYGVVPLDNGGAQLTCVDMQTGETWHFPMDAGVASTVSKQLSAVGIVIPRPVVPPDVNGGG